MCAEPARASVSLIVLARWPEIGAVKTRLAPALGELGAARFYRAMLTRTLRESAAFPATRHVWAHTGQGAQHPSALMGPEIPARFSLVPQCGTDLGARMQYALTDALRFTESALLIGADCPAIDQTYLQRAFEALHAGADVVLGPSCDGGYVLVGVRHHCPEMFAGIPYSTPAVLSRTQQRLEGLGRQRGRAYAVALLDTQMDLDTPDDLVAWTKASPVLASTVFKAAGLSPPG